MKKFQKKISQQKIHVKVGDSVKVISGQDKGKTGIVNAIIRQKNKIIVKGINIKFKHLKPSQPGETGEIKQMEFPIDSSNVCKSEE